jgi:hypothetical protein
MKISKKKLVSLIKKEVKVFAALLNFYAIDIVERKLFDLWRKTSDFLNFLKAQLFNSTQP